MEITLAFQGRGQLANVGNAGGLVEQRTGSAAR
jgi:hypothetical protein